MMFEFFNSNISLDRFYNHIQISRQIYINQIKIAFRFMHHAKFIVFVTYIINYIDFWA